MTTIFSKIRLGLIEGKIIYQDDLVFAFPDQNPQAPVHLLIVPNQPIARLTDIQSNDRLLLGHLLYVGTQLANQFGIAESGFRFLLNCNEDAGQTVFHIHLHLLGGKPLGPLLSPEVAVS